MSNKDIKLSSKLAVEYVIKEYGYTSYYSIAKALSHSGVNVQTIQITNYIKGIHVMSERVAEQFLYTFDIFITDAYHSKGRPPEW